MAARVHYHRSKFKNDTPTAANRQKDSCLYYSGRLADRFFSLCLLFHVREIWILFFFFSMPRRPEMNKRYLRWWSVFFFWVCFVTVGMYRFCNRAYDLKDCNWYRFRPLVIDWFCLKIVEFIAFDRFICLWNVNLV